MLADNAAALAPDEAYRSLISGAQKFMFLSDAVAAILAIEKEQFMRCWQFARPPFPVCWFEYLAADILGDARGEIKRIGLLVQANDADDPYAIEIEAFFIVQDGETRKSDVIKTKLFYEHELKKGGEDDAESSNWWAVLLAYRTLLVLNTKNYIQHETTNHNNAKRERRGKRSLFSYHICRVRRDRVMKSNHNQSSPPRDAPALHIVTGHFKRIGGGVHWWSPHARGNPKRGVVHKEYRV